MSTSTIISNFRSHASPIRSHDSLLLLLSCCCIWLSGPGFQDLDIWLSRLMVINSRDRYLVLTIDDHRLTVTDRWTLSNNRAKFCLNPKTLLPPTFLRDSLLLLLPPCFYTRVLLHLALRTWVSGPRYLALTTDGYRQS